MVHEVHELRSMVNGAEPESISRCEGTVTHRACLLGRVGLSLFSQSARKPEGPVKENPGFSPFGLLALFSFRFCGLKPMSSAKTKRAGRLSARFKTHMPHPRTSEAENSSPGATLERVREKREVSYTNVLSNVLFRFSTFRELASILLFFVASAGCHISDDVQYNP